MDLASGRRKLSSDSDTHLALYLAFEALGGVIHTHTCHATIWVQTTRALPAWGTHPCRLFLWRCLLYPTDDGRRDQRSI